MALVKALSATSGACLAAAALTLLAIAPLPYGYYVFLRWAACGASLAAGVALLGRQRFKAALPAWALAILFNPVFRVPLDREVWTFFNLVAAGLLVWWASACRASDTEQVA